MFCGVVVQVLCLKVLRMILPGLAKKIILTMGEKSTMTQNPKFKYEDWGPTFTSTPFIKTVIEHLWFSLGQDAFEGGQAPDSPVVSLEGKKTSIFQFLTGNRPLVLSFGSCT